MQLVQSYIGLEAVAPGLDTNPVNINPGGPVPAYFNDLQWPGGTTMILAGAAFAAGLSKRSQALPAGVSQFTLSYMARPSALAAALWQINETDLMIVDSAANRYNGSVRKNFQKGGIWEIVDANGNWIPFGLSAGLWQPGAWSPAKIVIEANWASKTSAVISIADNGRSFAPAAPLFIPAAPNSGWQPSIVDFQWQGTLLKAGAYICDMTAIDISMQ